MYEGDEERITCQSCNEAIPPGAKFCSMCGKPIESENRGKESGALSKTTPVVCASCGVELRNRATFCHMCGTALEPESFTRRNESSQTKAATALAEQAALVLSKQNDLDKSALADSPPTEAPPREPANLTCGTCNAQVQLAGKFCPMCGASLAPGGLQEVKHSPETLAQSTMLDRRYVEALAKLVEGKPVKDWHDDFMTLVDTDLPPFHKYLTFAFLGRGFVLQNNSVRAEEMILKARAVLASLLGLSGKQYEDYVLAKSEHDNSTLTGGLSKQLMVEGQLLEGCMLAQMGHFIRPSESTSWWPTSEDIRPLEALKYLPPSLEEHLFLASVYLDVGDVENAISLLEELKSDPKLKLGRSQSMIDKYLGQGLPFKDEGFFLCLEYVKEAYFHNLLGGAYVRNGDFHLAIGELKNFRNFNPPREKISFFQIVEVLRAAAEEKIQQLEEGELKSEENKKENLIHDKERLVNPAMRVAPSVEHEAGAKGFINAYYSLAEWPRVFIAAGIGLFLGLLFFGIGYVFTLFYLPVLLGVSVVVGKSTTFVSWLGRFDKWLIETRKQVDDAKDYIT